MPPRRAKAADPAPKPRQTPSRRIKPAPVPTGAATADASSMPPAGRTAAREVYETLDIRTMIYELLDRPTSFGLLRLEKNGVTSAANVLFKEVHISHFKKICRKSPRRAVYCAAVRIIDISPPPDISYLSHDHLFKKTADPTTRFNIPSLLRNLLEWQTFFPELNTIRNEFPPPGDDAYTVRLRGEKKLVELRSCVEINPRQTPFPAGGPDLPSIPLHPDFVIRQTIDFRQILGLSSRAGLPAEGDLFHGNAAARAESQSKWYNWLLRNPTLDRRIVTADYTLVNNDENVPGVCLLEAPTALLAQRRERGSEPMIRVTIPDTFSVDPPSFARFRQFIVGAGQYLRTLRMALPILRDPADFQTVITTLDQSLPRLAELALTINLGSRYIIPTNTVVISDFTPPASALPNLRSVEFGFRPHIHQDPRIVASLMAPLGSNSCVYRLVGLRNQAFEKGFNAMVRKLKFPHARPLSTKGEKPNPLEELGDEYRKAFR